MLIRLGTQTIEYGPLKETESERHENRLAMTLGRKLLKLADGRRRDDPETWIAVAKEVGCRCKDFSEPRSSTRGEYCPSFSGMGVITYNRAVTTYSQARTIVHELAHHLLLVLGLIPWFEAQNVVRYEYGGTGGGWHYSHRMARRVERFVFGF